MQASTLGQGRTMYRKEVQLQLEYDEMGASLDIASPYWGSA